MTHRVFVYGTLKRRGSNNPLLAGSKFLGEGVTLPAYKMVETSFPIIMPDPSGKPVAGEVYAVDDATLARLDRLEREGRSYDRVLIHTVLTQANGERLPIQAFIYVGREDRFGEMFARGPLYQQANERGELDWRAC
ncbi:MAG: gamma-glutamylcyclotransferase family protein [Bradyrhizobium sp.]|jgi:gamma-glutamylcyclotransferase (GGCT)/AIG2-like uncharacterized protein YtfP